MATSLSAFLQLNELSDEEMEDDDLLTEGETAWYAPLHLSISYTHVYNEI